MKKSRLLTSGLFNLGEGFFMEAALSVLIQFLCPEVKKIPTPSSYCCFNRLKLSMMTPINKFNMKNAPKTMKTTKNNWLYQLFWYMGCFFCYKWNERKAFRMILRKRCNWNSSIGSPYSYRSLLRRILQIKLDDIQMNMIVYHTDYLMIIIP